MQFIQTKSSVWSLLLLGLVILPAAASLAASAAASGAKSSAGPSRVLSRNKNNGHVVTYTFPEGNDLVPLSTVEGSVQPNDQRQRQPQTMHPLRRLALGVRHTFLPSGYPSPVRPHFLGYCAWSLTQDLTTQLRSVLATQRVLEGVGVGRPGATALSALLNFLCRDGCGMLASLLFTSLAATRFRHHVKQWRLLADIMVDIGITLEVLAVQMPPAYFLPMISVGSMCKAICGVAAGAAGGAINLYWAKGFARAGKGSDISEVQAKFGAQNTVAGALGLVASALFARSASRVQLKYVWLLYGALTALHIFANVQCMRLLAFDTFNTLRLQIVAADFLTKAAVDAYSEQTLTPSEVTRREPLFFLPSRFLPSHSPVPIHFGVSFAEFSHRSGLTPEELRLQLAQHPAYFLAVGGNVVRRRGTLRLRKSCVLVALPAHATERDQVQAHFHALALAEAVAAAARRQPGGAALADPAERRRLELETRARVDGHLWNEFAAKCARAGWDLSGNQLTSRGFEVVLSE